MRIVCSYEVLIYHEYFSVPNEGDQLGEEGVALRDFVFAELVVGLEGEIVGLYGFHKLRVVHVGQLAKYLSAERIDLSN